MKNKSNNFTYIDGANLHRGVASSGWSMDYHRFRVWLSEKYGVKLAYLQKRILQIQKEKAPDADETA